MCYRDNYDGYDASVSCGYDDCSAEYCCVEKKGEQRREILSVMRLFPYRAHGVALRVRQRRVPFVRSERLESVVRRGDDAA